MLLPQGGQLLKRIKKIVCKRLAGGGGRMEKNNYIKFSNQKQLYQICEKQLYQICNITVLKNCNKEFVILLL